MISILWYSICNFIAGFSPTFSFLFFFRALLGIGMGAEWPAGASLAMEILAGALARPDELACCKAPGRSASCCRAPPTACSIDCIGWRGLLWIGILPALVVVWVRKYVKEPEVWLENRRKQREQKQRGARCRCSRSSSAAMLGNTLTACWWMASAFVVYYSIFGAVRDASAEGSGAVRGAGVGAADVLQRRRRSLPSFLWGWVADVFGRRWSMIIPAVIALASRRSIC